jgi:hypothetical protein
MMCSANLISRGNKIMIGKSTCEVIHIIQDFGKITFQLVTPTGRIKTETFKPDQLLKCV